MKQSRQVKLSSCISEPQLYRLWFFSPKNLLSAMIARPCHDSMPYNSLAVAFMVSAADVALKNGEKYQLQEHR